MIELMKNLALTAKSTSDMATVSVAGAKAARGTADAASMPISVASKKIARADVLRQYSLAVKYYDVPEGYSSEWLYGWRNALTVLR